MDWYVVVKTINGQRYRYRQKTWREGGRVRTRSVYIGRADGGGPSDRSAPTTLPLPFPTSGQHSGRDFDKAITNRSLHALVDEDALNEKWEHAWSPYRRDNSLVQRDPRVLRMLTALEVKRTHGTRGAFYNPNSDIVNIPPARCFIDKPEQTATQAYHIVLFHELVHWTLPKARTGRDITDYAKEELVAELGAVMLMNHFGLEIGNLKRHARYFQVWLNRTDDREEALDHAKSQAERAVEYILEHGIKHP